VYNSQNYCVFGLCSSSGILKNQRTQRFGKWISFHPQVRGQTSTLLGPLEKAVIGTQLSRCLPPYLTTETDPVSETLPSLVFKTPDDGQGPETQ
jgi:hypothetical protein